MAIFISHTSALEFWSSKTRFSAGPTDANGFPQTARCSRLFEASSISEETFDAFVTSGLDTFSRPLHVLVPSSKARWRKEFLRQHVHSGPLPNASFVALGKDIYVASPEMALLQSATMMPFPALVKTAVEFCASYAVENGGESSARGFIDCAPLTTTDRIGKFLARAQGEYGTKSLRRALPYMTDGTASPMETALYLLLCMPRSEGGYGLPKPLVNFSIEVDRRRNDTRLCICDFYWPERKVCVEYDSDAYHSSGDEISNDSSRRNTLMDHGITTVSVTKKHVMNRRETDRVAAHIAKLLGKRTRTLPDDFVQQQLRLRHLLLKMANE